MNLLTLTAFLVFIDVSNPIPYPPTPEVVEALRLRILQVRANLVMARVVKVAPRHSLTIPIADLFFMHAMGVM